MDAVVRKHQCRKGAHQTYGNHNVMCSMNLTESGQNWSGSWLAELWGPATECARCPHLPYHAWAANETNVKREPPVDKIPSLCPSVVDCCASRRNPSKTCGSSPHAEIDYRSPSFDRTIFRPGLPCRLSAISKGPTMSYRLKGRKVLITGGSR